MCCLSTRERERERETERETEREREKERKRERKREREEERERKRDRETERVRERKRDRETEKQRENVFACGINTIFNFITDCVWIHIHISELFMNTFQIMIHITDHSYPCYTLHTVHV